MKKKDKNLLKNMISFFKKLVRKLERDFLICFINNYSKKLELNLDRVDNNLCLKLMILNLILTRKIIKEVLKRNVVFKLIFNLYFYYYYLI